jgi:SAM-dependent methyltransferase
VSHVFFGSGPGAQARDGCSIELYRRLAYLGEIDCLRPLLHPGSSVLELGCGTGRITRVLLDIGLKVTAVDNSPEVLLAVPSAAETVCAEVEELRLAERFDTILLASCLINHAAPELRRAFLQTSRFHMKPNAQLLLEHHDPEWLGNVQRGLVSQRATATISVEAVARLAEVTEMTLRYQIGDSSWLHAFAVVALSEQDLRRLLAENRLCFADRPGSNGRWVRAVLASNGQA